MRVKKLELYGFKSFAHKTTIHFEPGVTAIVGPNGSGKSNLVDAIRWVLGEHNPRDVRAPRLEDVIFNGTDNAAPLSVAEVTLSIDNQRGLLPIAFSEVEITRRVYRSGESEYAINQAPCRLKDIQQLFLGTGLGGGTYAIIEQGHIDMVLSSKPEERRVVFEEASGVAKYLAKKQETTRRLEEVEEHLVRLADIASEVRRQVSALERQAAKARRYKEQWEQLKSMELRVAVDELRQGGARDAEVEERVKTLSAQRAELDAQKQARLSSLESCNAAVSAIQQRLQALQTRRVEVASQVEQHASQLQLKTGWIEQLTSQAKQLELETAQLAGRLQQCEEQAAQGAVQEAELLQALEGAGTDAAQAGERLAQIDGIIQQALASLTEAKAQLFGAASEAAQSRNTVIEATTRLKALDARLGRLEGQRAQLGTRAQDVRGRLETASREQDLTRQQAEALEHRSASSAQTLAQALARRDELTVRVHQAQEQLAAARAQREVFEGLWRRFEGFPEAVKSLMAEPIDGVLGPLVDLLETAPGYEPLAEAALGPLVEAIVVRDRRALVRCRQALSTKTLESCRFIVLEDCPRQPLPMEQPASQAGLTGAVKQFVRGKGGYQPLVDWLLDDSWVIDDIERLLGERDVPRRRLVSPRGDRWDRRSWRFNGAGGPSRFGRRQRWEQAEAAVETWTRTVEDAVTSAKAAEDQWQTLLGQQESDKGQLAQVVPALQKLDQVIAQLREESRRIEDEQRAAELDTQELGAQAKEVTATLTGAERAAQEAERSQETIERALAEAQATRETAEHERQQALVAKAQREASRQSLTERAAVVRQRREEVDAERARLGQQVEQKRAQQQEAVARAQQLSAERETHRRERPRLEDERGRCVAEEQEVSDALRQAEAQRNHVMPEVLAVEQQLAALAQQIQDQERQLAERGFRRTHLVERLRELYQIDEATIEAERHSDTPALTPEQRAELAERVGKLRATLESLGPVSLGSVEEYDELKRRHEFLQTQTQDLIKARDDLKASIAQINRAARTQFREIFVRIQEEFKHYFTRLFNGGKADVVLLDEEDVLETGIEIVAQPPGKRLQSISLLSGGERALTAIALLFALFKVRPSPFCILDEIDAPLDEANVDRFTRVLEEFLSLSQFILITHNKKTITKADSLYGVTMEEAGISKILSARLSPARA